MSTNSSIAILNLDGTVHGHYCHNNGALLWNGQKLYLHYKNLYKVRQLISLGDMSILDVEVSPPSGVEHSFNNKHEGVSVFYGRDRGEKGVDTQKYNSLEHYLKDGNFQEYDYLFNEKKNEWYLIHQETKKLQKLSSALLKIPEISDNTKQMINSERQAKKLERDLKKKDKVIKIKL